MTRELLAAYLATDYIVDLGRAGEATVRVGLTLEPALKARLAAHEPWVYLTAENPGSRCLSPEANAARRRRLRARVLSRYPRTRPGEGRGEDGRWRPERSLWIPGIGLREGLGLAGEFGQLAVVAGRRGGRARLVLVPPRLRTGGEPAGGDPSLRPDRDRD